MAAKAVPKKSHAHIEINGHLNNAPSITKGMKHTIKFFLLFPLLAKCGGVSFAPTNIEAEFVKNNIHITIERGATLTPDLHKYLAAIPTELTGIDLYLLACSSIIGDKPSRIGAHSEDGWIALRTCPEYFVEGWAHEWTHRALFVRTGDAHGEHDEEFFRVMEGMTITLLY